jgi:hypothetical protein
MSYNGTGTFNINTAGQPVVTGTTITSTAFNLLTADLATGLTTALTKDGQTTPTANIPMGTFKITGLGAGTAATDAAQYGQLQAGATTIATVSGTDTLTGSVTPALAAYATGNLFSFVAVATNTGATTINLNSLGAKSITKSGTTALAAGDLVTGQLYLIEYDGTRFQLINPSSISASVSSITFGSTGLTPSTATSGAVTVAGTLAVANGGTGATTLAGANIAVVNVANTFTGTQTFSGTSSATAIVLNDAAEVVTVSATAATGTINYDITTQSVLYYTTSASANWTVNFRASSGTSLNTLMSTGQSMTVAFLVTQGATAYYNNVVQVDGTATGVTTRWFGGAPTAGNASGIDSYRYLIIKTGSATFTVLASNTQFKA